MEYNDEKRYQGLCVGPPVALILDTHITFTHSKWTQRHVLVVNLYNLRSCG